MIREEMFMALAVEEAEKCEQYAEVPVGAIVVLDGKVIGRGRNMMEERQCQLYHAEVLAIKNACKVINNWRLNEAELYTTMEPCLMCYGLTLLSRIKRCFYILPQPRFGVSNFLTVQENFLIKLNDLYGYESKVKSFFRNRHR